ncbi:MAG: glycosyltransferase family 39 protein, partial [Nanoarchaeota archaeon]
MSNNVNRSGSKRSLKLMKKDILVLFFILIIALLLRLHNFRQEEVFISSDEVYAFEIAAKPIYGLLSGDIYELATQLFRYFNYPWGWVSLTGTTVVAFIVVLFHIPITEFTINIGGVIIGLLSIISLYLLCLRLTEKRLIAFFSALIFAILPIHVALSRSVTVNNMYSTALFFLTLFFFLSYFKKSEEQKKQSKKELAFGMIALGFYLGADNQFPGILPILFVSGLLFYNQKKMLQRVIGVFQ